MRARDARRRSVASLRNQLVVAVGLLGVLFALLVAAASPGLAGTFALGALSIPAGRRAVDLLGRTDGVCVPGTSVCLRASY